VNAAQPSRNRLTAPDGSKITQPFVPEISYYSTVMNTNSNTLAGGDFKTLNSHTNNEIERHDL